MTVPRHGRLSHVAVLAINTFTHKTSLACFFTFQPNIRHSYPGKQFGSKAFRPAEESEEEEDDDDDDSSDNNEDAQQHQPQAMQQVVYRGSGKQLGGGGKYLRRYVLNYVSNADGLGYLVGIYSSSRYRVLQMFTALLFNASYVQTESR